VLRITRDRVCNIKASVALACFALVPAISGCRDTSSTSMLAPTPSKTASVFSESDSVAAGVSDLSVAIDAEIAFPLAGTKFYPWQRNDFRSRKPGIATVNTKGTIRGVTNGRTYVVVQYKQMIDSALVVVGNGEVLSMSPGTATLRIGDSLSLALNSPVSSVAFASADTSVATVSSRGVVSPRGAGSTTISARPISGSSATMQVSIPMAPSPAAVVVNVGSQVTISPGPLSAQCRSGAVVYSVQNPAIATVSSAGRVTGVAVGTTSVQVTSGVCVAAVPISSVATTSNGVPTGAVAVDLTRFQGAAGLVTFSNGIPLPVGQLRSSDLGKVRLFLGGTEQSIFVRALGGTHADGSLRAILVQGRVMGPAAPQYLAGYMTFDTQRTTAPFTEVPAPSTLDAAVLPTSADYLVSTNVAGPMVTSAQIATMSPDIRAQFSDFETMAPPIFAATTNSFSRGIAVYEHVLSHYQHFIETANPRWYQMAWQMGEAYRAYGATGAPEWNISTEGLAVHYWFTGNERARAVVGQMTEWLTGGTEYIYKWQTAEGAFRFKGRSMLAAVDCVKIACNPGFDKYNYPYPAWDLNAVLPAIIPRLASTQIASGLFPGVDYGGGQKNYMVGIQLTALTRYYDEIRPDPAVLAMVKKSLDYMWANEWNASGPGFRYCSIRFSDCDQSIQRGLNNLILPAYIWYYARTRDGSYLTIADQIFAGARLARTEWPAYYMQFDQAMYRVSNYYAMRQ